MEDPLSDDERAALTAISRWRDKTSAAPTSWIADEVYAQGREALWMVAPTYSMLRRLERQGLVRRHYRRWRSRSDGWLLTPAAYAILQV